MARVSEIAKYKVAILGDTRDFSKSIKAVSQDVHGLGNRMKIAGYGMKQMFHGDFAGGWKTLKQSMSGFMRNADGTINKSKVMGTSLMALATVTAGVTVAFYALHRAVVASLDSWSKYVGEISAVNRLTNISYRESSQLIGQWRLMGIEGTKGATGIKFFAKNLDQARQGVKSYADAFNRLGVNIKGKSTAQVLNETRDAISRLGKGATSTAMAMKLFGRGGADLLKWLLADKDAIKENIKYVRSLGLEFGQKGVQHLKDFMKEKRKLSLGWEAIKINAGRALGPIVSKYMADISGWIAKNMPRIKKTFREWGHTIDSLRPSISKVVGKLGEWALWITAHQQDIKDFFKDVASAAQNVADFINAIAAAMERVAAAAAKAKAVLGGSGAGGAQAKGGKGGAVPGGNPTRDLSGITPTSPTIVVQNPVYVGTGQQSSNAAARWMTQALQQRGARMARGYA